MAKKTKPDSLPVLGVPAQPLVPPGANLAPPPAPEPAKPELPPLPDNLAPLKNALIGLLLIGLEEATDARSRLKIATHATALMGAVVQIVPDAVDEKDFEKKLAAYEMPVEFFAHLPGQLRTAAVMALTKLLTEEAQKVLEGK